MKRTHLFSLISIIAVLGLLLTSCAKSPDATQPAPEAGAEVNVQAEEGETVAIAETSAKPTTVKIAFFACGPKDEPWAQALIQAVERIKAEKPEGLDIQYKWFESIPVDDFEKFVRDAIETREYDIIWIHDLTSGTDIMDNFKKEYPDQLFGVSASNYYPIGGNTYFFQQYAHEPSFLCGVIAGLMTETNKIGMVAGYPYASVNHQLQGFIDGAKSVNPDVEYIATYINTWVDPVKAKETALAQIEAGADIMFAERYGAHEAARDAGILAFGNQSDIHDLAPETIITSPLMYWDPSVRYLVEEWYDKQVNGTEYDAPADKPVFFLMNEGGSGIAPLYDFETSLPADVLAKYNEAKQAILDGDLKVELKLDEVVTE